MVSNFMFIDLTLTLSREVTERAFNNVSKAFSGHLGTHFDVMDKEFPLDYCVLEGAFFDVRDRVEIGVEDIDVHNIKEGMFIGFYTGHIEKYGYGTTEYSHDHPYLSRELIDYLLSKKVRIIGVDLPGVRRGKEHSPCDQYCADRGAFIIENMCNMEKVCGKKVTVYTFPLKFEGSSGLPCRVVAGISEQ